MALPRLDWRRILVEGVVIVSSILLAFAIDAAWDSAQERRRAQDLVDALRNDVTDTRAYIAVMRDQRQELVDHSRAVLEGLAGGVEPPARDSLLERVGTAFSLALWTPATATYDQAIGSGDLSLLRDQSVRATLGHYHASLDAVGTIVDAVSTQYYGLLETFLVDYVIYSEIAAEGYAADLVSGAPFSTDFDVLARDPRLWNLLTLKLENEVALVRFLDRADSAAVRVLASLPEVDRARGDRHPGIPYVLAQTALLRGDRTAALEHLEEWSRRSGPALFLTRSRLWDPLRTEPRFRSLERDMAARADSMRANLARDGL